MSTATSTPSFWSSLRARCSRAPPGVSTIPANYLWSLGNGAFALRQRDVLTLLQPLAGLATGNAFAEQPFIKSNRPIGSVLLSPEDDLLTLETLDRSPYLPRPTKPSPGTSAYAAAAASAAAAGDAAAEEPQGLVQIDFFRLHREPRAASPEKLDIARAGTVAARNMVLLPIDADGFLSVLDEGSAHWAFNFNSHQGKIDELSPFDSSCHPIPFLVSRSEFVAFGCRGGKDPRELGGFNLRGEEMWEQTFTDSFTAASLLLRSQRRPLRPQPPYDQLPGGSGAGGHRRLHRSDRHRLPDGERPPGLHAQLQPHPSRVRELRPLAHR